MSTAVANPNYFGRTTFRPAQREDAPAIAKFSQALDMEQSGQSLSLQEYTEGFLVYYESPVLGTFWMMEHHGSLIGMFVHKKEFHLKLNSTVHGVERLYIVQEHRGQSLAPRVFKLIEHRALQANDAQLMELVVRPDNQRAIRCYHKAGFQESGIRMVKYLEQPIDPKLDQSSNRIEPKRWLI